MKCAIVENSVVIECPVELDEVGVQEYSSKYEAVIDIGEFDVKPQEGWHLVNGVLIDPDSVGNGGVALITRFAFRNRFTATEKAALNGFIRTGPAPYCYIAEAMKDDMMSAQHINRGLQAMKDGMAFLVQIGVLTQSRSDEILNTPAKPYEIYRGE